MFVDLNHLQTRGIALCCECDNLYSSRWEEDRCPECMAGICSNCRLESQAVGFRGQCADCAARWNPRARRAQLEREAEARQEAGARAASYPRPYRILPG